MHGRPTVASSYIAACGALDGAHAGRGHLLAYRRAISRRAMRARFFIPRLDLLRSPRRNNNNNNNNNSDTCAEAGAKSRRRNSGDEATTTTTMHTPLCNLRFSGVSAGRRFAAWAARPDYDPGAVRPLCNVSPSSLHSRALDLMRVAVIAPYTHASSHLRALNRTSTRPTRALVHRALPLRPPLPTPPDTTRQSQEQQ
ncbi:hypothetical protein HETIRDRAFT_107735 [Heterobasidion irregulare TC 32-1]|uniref:Uncharacterized protein n=1 Tax=Heterobasidion irregulare (strain TC 32-1) TaxID=747525 RepID=W4JYE6_HETIT|nr:uncharacterized protein HETIRDRAFT_107735 [Heterobasidion irregulare TC 32-1]ETW78130.1 hypothetical protein HETIRDRAFT_107735 [Heterobasidion irregulare TC 32-1]